MPVLEQIGWTAARHAEFASYAAQGLIPGRVALEHNHVYRVWTTDGERLAEASGRLKHAAAGRHDLPAVGDWIALRERADGRSTIAAILPRTSAFVRQRAGREALPQVVAANVDTVFLVAGLDRDFNPRRLERYLVLARQSGTTPVIVLNKSDLVDDAAPIVETTRAIAAGAPVHLVSTATGAGFGALDQYLSAGHTVALLGSSGVGKSSIINRWLGESRLPTAAVRASDDRGRHTSVHRRMIDLPQGAVVIDTPGMRELQLWDGARGLEDAFADVDALAASCRFRDCRHDAEPGCAVKAAVAAGTIDPARHAAYLKLRREREALADKQEERRRRSDQ